MVTLDSHPRTRRRRQERSIKTYGIKPRSCSMVGDCYSLDTPGLTTAYSTCLPNFRQMRWNLVCTGSMRNCLRNRIFGSGSKSEKRRGCSTPTSTKQCAIFTVSTTRNLSEKIESTKFSMKISFGHSRHSQIEVGSIQDLSLTRGSPSLWLKPRPSAHRQTLGAQ